MTEHSDPGDPGAPAPAARSTASALASLYAARFAQFAPQEQRQLLAAAAPHRFTLDLLALLLAGSPPAGAGHETGDEAAALLQWMQQQALVQEVGQGWFAFPSPLRHYLVGRLQAETGLWREAHARCAAYFGRLGAQDESQPLNRSQLEAIYHLLVVDEAQALAQAQRAFQAAEATAQLGPVERLLDLVVEQASSLSVPGRQWLAFWQARLAQLLRHDVAAMQPLSDLAQSAADPRLRAAARRSLAERATGERRWLDAVATLQAALIDLAQQELPEEVAYTRIALAAVYISLAEATGGLRGDATEFAHPPSRLLYRIQHAPFLLYRWFSRRYAFVPNLYFGTDYQNWTVIRILHAALAHFDAAERTLAAIEGQPNERQPASIALLLRQVRIRQADITWRIGRWRKATSAFAALRQDPMVQQVPYLVATVELGIGRVRLREDAQEAADLLGRSLEVFAAAGDDNMIGLAAFWLGKARAALRDPAGAAAMYRRATLAFQDANNLLDATEALAAAANFPPNLPPEDAPPLEDAGIAQRAYVARFPQSLQTLFRLLAIFAILPLTYLLIRTLAGNLSDLSIRIDVALQALLDLKHRGTAIVDVLVVLPLTLAMPLVWLWLYELLYALAGLALVRLLPLRVLTGEQPVYLLTGADGCGLYDSQGAQQAALPWDKVTFTAALDRGLWRQPFALFSCFLAGGAREVITVDGITSNYRLLQQDIRAHVAAATRKQSRHHDLRCVLLAPRWVAVTLAITLALALISLSNLLGPDPGEWSFLFVRPPSGEIYTVYASSLLWWFLYWLMLVGPFLLLLHLLYTEWRTRRVLGRRAPSWYAWTALLALLALLGFAAALVRAVGGLME